MDQETRNKLISVLLELLDEFVRICNENNLVYFLSYGTLLGAVRHKGFIPWDDDIDVCMPRDDFEKFIDIFEKSNNENYYVLSHKSNCKAGLFCKYFAKICKTGTTFAESYRPADAYPGIFIDIFPLDNCLLAFLPIQTFSIRFFLDLCRTKANIIITKKNIKLFIGKIFVFFLPESLLNKIHRKLYLIFNRRKTKYLSLLYGGYGYSYKTLTHKYDVIFPLSSVLFEGKYYNAPSDCDSFLKTLYGNYMELPPVEKRHVHRHEYIIFE